ncbi:sulfotransferase [Dasania sp. GY-MA-18]|uniref:Sulfotransferase n=1 Tax=Dasania phycosphaerae TaxID=2950436 RepID=A0A9J6RLA9_9GAMM|nr:MULTISPECIES: tetratricopeptide repeat-containing sulfotransferase family protein [Dasania]MCR8922361.1 sulfotransferase [Dasania sp. GY-MA-18]MCZ0864789.1 sulfotransferase [Dasania phycosphaerae]MCZ0868517.1 sulfotransferase [Dasania phycosphaerae]
MAFIQPQCHVIMASADNNNEQIPGISMPHANHESALQLLNSQQFAEAESLLRKHLQLHSDDHIALTLLGHSLIKQQRLAGAIQLFKRVCELKPNLADAYGNLGLALQQQQDFSQAIAMLKKAVALDDNYHDAWNALGNLLMHTGQQQEGAAALIRAEQTDPFAPAMEAVAQAMSKQDYAQAEAGCREILQRHGHHPGAIAILAQLATQQKQWAAAEQMLQHALDYSPFNLGLWHKLAEVSSHAGKHEQRVYAAQQCVNIAPDQAHLASILGSSLAHAGKYQQALDAYERAAQLDPADANIQIQRGHILKTLGRREQAIQAFRHSIALREQNGVAYWALADFKNFDFNADDIAAMQAIAKDETAAAEHRSQAGFALANALERQADYAAAFEHYLQANKLRPNADFDAQQLQKHAAEGRELFGRALLQNKTSLSPNGPRPIFIVGLPRSGSTLIEQILASHSAIEGTMELPNLPRVMETLYQDSRQSGMSIEQFFERIPAENLSAYGQKYLDDTAIFRNGAPYFIDKLPPNFRLVGFIHLILPEAIIIDARRHPLDAGLSAFKQHFAAGHEFSYDLHNIGAYYNEYLKMMDHWDQVLPGKVLCQHYSEMINNTEQSVRRLLQHCGLEFEAACLDFHKNTRAVHTASSEQVRQPIYKTGVGHWQNFEPWLGPLLDSLGEETLARFE